MLTAFIRNAAGAVDAVTTVAELQARWDGDAAIAWVDLEGTSEDELRAVHAVLHLDEAAIEDCLSGEQRPRIDLYDEQVALVLYGALGPEPAVRFDPRKLVVICGRRFLLTVHAEPLRTIQTLRERQTRQASRGLSNGTDLLLYQIMDMLIDNFLVLADRYEDRLEELEERSLTPGVDEAILEDVLELRRDLLQIRHLAVSQRELLTPLAEGDFDFIGDDLGQRFRHVRDHAIKVVESLDAQRERLTGVCANHQTAIATRTNEIMRVLTVFAAVMLPLSLVAGIYGMNLPLWPPPDHPGSFWGVLAAMVAGAAGLLYYFRRRGWL